MTIDEEYLDSLLRSVQEEEKKTDIQETEEKSEMADILEIAEELETAESENAEEAEMSDIWNAENEPETADSEEAEISDIWNMTDEPADEEQQPDFSQDFFSMEADNAGSDEENAAEEDDGAWKADLDRLLAVTDDETSSLEDVDVTQYIDNMQGADEDLSEISELLKKSDNHETVESDDDMLALLESLGNVDTGESDNQETFDIFAEESSEEQNEPKKSFFKKKKEKSGSGKGFSFGKKRSKKQEEAGEENSEHSTEETEKADGDSAVEESDNLTFNNLSFENADENVGFESPEGFIMEGISEEEIANWDALIPDRDSEKEQKGKGKKNRKAKEKKKKDGTEATGFLKRLSDLLFEEAEEEDTSGEKTDENGEILKELEQEDKAKAGKKKKEKKKKDKKGKKGKDSENVEGEGEEGEDTEPAPKKKKKPKKEKKVKEKKPVEKEKKVLSRKALLVLIAFCATLIAAVVSLSLFLPDYADKKNAREAFYAGDYKETYRLFYDKNLNSSDTLIFKRAEMVLTLQRKQEAYENHKKLGNETKALDALFQGIAKFDELQSYEQYGAQEELRQIYEKLLDALEQDYSIGEEEAKEINTYDADTYSRKIYSVITGTDFVKPGEEKIEEPAVPVDVLPEEEDIIDMENAGVSF